MADAVSTTAKPAHARAGSPRLGILVGVGYDTWTADDVERCHTDPGFAPPDDAHFAHLPSDSLKHLT